MIHWNYRKKKDWPVLLEIMLVAMILMPSAGAVCPLGGSCGSSGNDAWLQSAQDFLSSDVPLVGLSQGGSVETGSFKAGEPVGTAVKIAGSETVPKVASDFVEPESRTGLFPAGELLAPMEGILGRDVIVDVSNQRSEGDGHIKGAIVVPSKSFLLDDGTLRPVSDMAAILGAAGISQEDPVIVYSDSFSSGEATFVLWLLRYLGHDDVKALDGGLEDWIKASLPLETKKNVRSLANYSPSKESKLLASYDFVKSGGAQMVDARTFQDFGKQRIPKAFLISPESVLESGKLKEAASLADTFAKLDQKKPVVVYSNDYFSASLVWYALQLMGFDSRLYTWQDWQAQGEAKVYEIK